MVETAEAPDAAPAPVETIEAVIISGPRRGEIVKLSEDTIPAISDGEIRLLNEGLDQVLAAIDRLDVEMRATLEVFQAPQGEHQRTGRFDRLAGEVAEIRERLTRLEVFRDADRARMQADLAQFKLEVEQAGRKPSLAAAKEIHQ
jgi:hypothetical protein